MPPGAGNFLPAIDSGVGGPAYFGRTSAGDVAMAQGEEGARTRTLSRFVAAFGSDRLPDDVRDRTTRLVLDGVGALLAAANPAYSTGRRIAAFVKEQGGAPQATVVGHGFRTGCAHAALANGTMGYACDFEPHHPEGILHPIAVVVPAALAIGERQGSSGRRFLDAVALGCEVEYRVSMALGPAEQYALGFHPSAVCGTFGAAASAGYLLGLDPEAMERAFGLAACQASGLMAWESDPTENARPFQMGMAARNGVTAALLAEAGFGGPAGVFDRGHTVFGAFSRAPSPERLVAGLGESWDGVMELAVKPHACVSFLHPALDALLDLVREHDLKPESVEEIRMRFARSGLHCIDDNPLKSHCAQYVLAVALARGGIAVPDLFEDRRLGAPEVAELSRRVRVIGDDGELEAKFPDFYATVIEVDTKGGARYSRSNDVARGYPETPLSATELAAKFSALAGTMADAERVSALAEAVRGLDAAPDLARIAELLGKPAT